MVKLGIVKDHTTKNVEEKIGKENKRNLEGKQVYIAGIWGIISYKVTLIVVLLYHAVCSLILKEKIVEKSSYNKVHENYEEIVVVSCKVSLEAQIFYRLLVV